MESVFKSFAVFAAAKRETEKVSAEMISCTCSENLGIYTIPTLFSLSLILAHLCLQDGLPLLFSLSSELK